MNFVFLLVFYVYVALCLVLFCVFLSLILLAYTGSYTLAYIAKPSSFTATTRPCEDLALDRRLGFHEPVVDTATIYACES